MCCVTPSLPICSMRAPICGIQLLLGHRDLETTSCYLHVSEARLHATASPLDGSPIRNVHTQGGNEIRLYGHRLEVADVFHALSMVSSFSAGAMLCRTSSGRCCAISACAVHGRAGQLISNDDRGQKARPSRTTHAATGTVPRQLSSTRSLALKQAGKPVFAASTPMWSSPYPNNWRCSTATRGSSTPCCFGQLLPRRCSRSLPIHAISVRASVCWPCRTNWSQNLRHHPHS